jgi:uncharacterized protein (DUF885 family)
VGAVRALADRYLERLLPLDPYLATVLGDDRYDDQLTDYSAEGVAARADLGREALAELARTDAADDADRLCGALLRERLGAELAALEADEHLRQLRIFGSPVSATREVFDLTPRETDADWANIAKRMAAVPEAYERFESALRSGMAKGILAAPRQSLACAEQTATWAGLDGADQPWFAGLAAEGPDSRRAELDRGAQAATAALESFTRFLRDEYTPRAEGVPDPVGTDRYVVQARQYLGADLDVDDAYAYGWAELERIEDDMRTVAATILPGASLLEVYAHLDAEGEAVDGEQALVAWLQALMDETMDALDGTHFDLSGDIRKVEAMLAPPGTSAAAYYTPPSEDYSRPGQTWYPTLGRTRFPIWEDVSTWYHEGVPGHHLQFGGWMAAGDRLSRYQRAEFLSGDAEGWALYAERLMDELGFFTAPDRRIGYLTAQQLRATRVVIDIGMHCELAIPKGQPFHPGERWTPEFGLEFLHQHGGPNPDFLNSEWIRYLGIPGQAISYKLGERVWLAGREAARRAAGSAFDLKGWHMAALLQGPLGLDDLAAELPNKRW